MNIASNLTWSFAKPALFCGFRTFGRRYSFNAVGNKGGLFGLGTIRQPKDFRALTEHVYERGRLLLGEALAGSRRKRKLVAVLDELSDTICQAADLAECIRMIHPLLTFAEEAENCVSQLSQFVESLNSNRDIYKVLRRSIETNDSDSSCLEPMDDIDRRVTALLIHDMEASGIHLPDDQRCKFIELHTNIFAVGSQFVRAAQKYKSANNPSTTEKKDFMHRQRKSLQSLLTLRHQLALLVGYHSYAERAVQGSFLETPARANQFLKSLAGELRTRRSVDDLSATMSLPTELDGARFDPAILDGVEPDVAILSLSQLISDKINPLAERLVGLHFEMETPKKDELWYPLVTKLVAYDVKNRGQPMGMVYCDWFDRERKCGEAHFTVRCGRELRNSPIQTMDSDNSSYQTPIVVLSFRLPLPSSNNADKGNDFWSSLIAFTGSQIETILHEFGHALHTLVGRTRYQHVSGTRCSTDLAEIPSTFMEHFILDDKAAQPLWGTIFDNYRSRSRKNAATEMLNQCVLALTDLHLHTIDPEKTTADEISALINKELSLPTPPEERLLLFEHLVSYGAKYHSYIVARALAALVWRRGGYFLNGFNNDSADIYRKFLSYGGEKYPRELLDLTIGHIPSAETLSRSLVDDMVDENEAKVPRERKAG